MTSQGGTRELQLSKKQDVFSSANFSATQFINQIYPDESSLGDLDKFIDVLRRQVLHLPRRSS
jgi:hypothetical protein